MHDIVVMQVFHSIQYRAKQVLACGRDVRQEEHTPYHLLSIELGKLASLSYELVEEFSACGVLKRQIIVMMRFKPFVEFNLESISTKKQGTKPYS